MHTIDKSTVYTGVYSFLRAACYTWHDVCFVYR